MVTSEGCNKYWYQFVCATNIFAKFAKKAYIIYLYLFINQVMLLLKQALRAFVDGRFSLNKLFVFTDVFNTRS